HRWFWVGFEARPPLHKNQAQYSSEYYQQKQLTQSTAGRFVFQQIFDLIVVVRLGIQTQKRRPTNATTVSRLLANRFAGRGFGTHCPSARGIIAEYCWFAPARKRDRRFIGFLWRCSHLCC